MKLSWTNGFQTVIDLFHWFSWKLPGSGIGVGATKAVDTMNHFRFTSRVCVRLETPTNIDLTLFKHAPHSSTRGFSVYLAQHCKWNISFSFPSAFPVSSSHPIFREKYGCRELKILFTWRSDHGGRSEVRAKMWQRENTTPWIIQPRATYHPGLVQEVIGGAEGVDGRYPAILETQQQVAPIFVRVPHVLSDQQEVGSEGSAHKINTRSKLKKMTTSFNRQQPELDCQTEASSRRSLWSLLPF